MTEIKCILCGRTVVAEDNADTVLCGHCGTSFSINGSGEIIDTFSEAIRSTASDTEIRCVICGRTVAVSGDTRVVCNHCGTVIRLSRDGEIVGIGDEPDAPTEEVTESIEEAPTEVPPTAPVREKKRLTLLQKIIIASSAVVLLIVAIYLFTVNIIIPGSKYSSAKKLIDNEKYAEAFLYLRGIDRNEPLDKLYSSLVWKHSSDYINGIYTNYTYDAEGKLTSKSSAGGESRYSYFYNGKGQLIEEEFYNNGKLSTITNYAYDKNGKLLEHERRSGSDNLLETYTCTYDKKGRLLTERTVNTLYSNKESVTEYKYYYDAYNRFSIKTTYFNSEELGSIRYEYDKEGKTVKKTNISRHGTVQSVTEYTYKNGLLVRSETVYPQIKEDAYVTQPYDSDEAIIEVYTYDKYGNLIEKEHTGPDSHGRWVYELDEYGNVLKVTEYSGDAAINTEQYEGYVCFYIP